MPTLTIIKNNIESTKPYDDYVELIKRYGTSCSVNMDRDLNIKIEVFDAPKVWIRRSPVAPTTPMRPQTLEQWRLTVIGVEHPLSEWFEDGIGQTFSAKIILTFASENPDPIWVPSHLHDKKNRRA